MKSPWLKKNPWLSMYLSGANAMAGAMRSRMTAEFRRQASTAMTEGLRQATAFWSGGLIQPAPPRKKNRARR